MVKNIVVVAGLVFLSSFILQHSAFAQSGGIKGKVRTTDGRGIARATVTASLDGKEIKSTKADEDGNFVMKGLSAGKYNVVFDAPGYASGTYYGVEIKKDIRNLGDRLILSIDRGTQVLIKGSVFFKEGTSVTGAKVGLARINSDGSVHSITSVYTNYSGEFTFRQQPGEAKFRVTATYKGVSGTKDVEVDMAAVYRLAISLDLSQADK